MSDIISNETKILKEELRTHIEPLLKCATRHKACIAGFVWGVDPPVFIRFANTTESGPDLAQLLIQLSSMAEDAENAGRVDNDPVK